MSSPFTQSLEVTDERQDSPLTDLADLAAFSRSPSPPDYTFGTTLPPHHFPVENLVSQESSKADMSGSASSQLLLSHLQQYIGQSKNEMGQINAKLSALSGQMKQFETQLAKDADYDADEDKDDDDDEDDDDDDDNDDDTMEGHCGRSSIGTDNDARGGGAFSSSSSRVRRRKENHQVIKFHVQDAEGLNKKANQLGLAQSNLTDIMSLVVSEITAIRERQDLMESRVSEELEKLRIKCTSANHNSIARSKNSQVIYQDQDLAPLRALNTNALVRNFPKTPAAIRFLTNTMCNDILTELDEDITAPDVKEKRFKIRGLIGLREYPWDA